MTAHMHVHANQMLEELKNFPCNIHTHMSTHSQRREFTMQVQESFGMTLSNDSAPLTTATVACFLIQEGADSSLRNHQGLLPTEVCSPVVAAMVMTFTDELQTKMYYR